MANDALTLKFNVPVTVHLEGKNAANTQNRTITDITFNATHPQVSITPGINPQDYNITNTNPTTGGNGQINWSAKNELGQTVTGVSQYSLQPADPAVTIEVKIVLP
jgi:cytochrome c oxidase assembly protein Cox11